MATINIRADGSRNDIHNLGGTKSEETRRALEKRYGLVVAAGRQNSRTLGIVPASIKWAEYGKSGTKRTITHIVHAVACSYHFTLLPECNAVLRQFNVVAERGHDDTEMFRRKGLLSSITDNRGNKLGIPISNFHADFGSLEG